jgi:IS605 OrfB family transposase
MIVYVDNKQLQIKMQRTIRLKLNPTLEESKVLSETIRQYTDSFNAVTKLGWSKSIIDGVKLHKETYQDQKLFTRLPSQLVISARMKATEALVSAKELKRKGKTVTCPVSKNCPIRYDKRSYTVWFERNLVSLATLKGRIKLTIDIPEYYQQYLTWKSTSADLVKTKKGDWFLHIVMETDAPIYKASEQVVGVDLGVNVPAVDSENNFYGDANWKQIEDKTFQLRRRLQKKGTKSAKRHLKKLSGRQKRFRKDCDHVISKRLVQSVESGATLVFEDLVNIRSRSKVRKQQRRRIHGWSFRQLQTFVDYKAKAKGVKVDFVDPRYTSQKCSCCGHREKASRQSQAVFKCKKCGYSTNADFNAATNIRNDYLKCIENVIKK